MTTRTHRRSWVLPNVDGGNVIVSARGAGGRARRALLPRQLDALVARLTTDPIHAPVIREMLEQSGGSDRGGDVRAKTSEELRALLRGRFDRRLLVAESHERRMGAAGITGALDLPVTESDEPPIGPSEDDALTWFSLKIVDEWNVPVADVEVSLDVDGRARTLRSNAAGLIRIDGARQSFASARLRSPDRIEEALRKRGGDPAARRPAEGVDVRTVRLGSDLGAIELVAEKPTTLILSVRQWVGIRLLDGAGRGVPGRAYRIITASGKTLEGSLDERGQARLDDVDEGPCSVVFPDIDDAMLESAS
jgi:hypothetical protein